MRREAARGCCRNRSLLCPTASFGPPGGCRKTPPAKRHHLQRLSDSAATEKIFLFDIIPRIIEASEWNWIEKGLKQRIHALNLFIDDIYHEQKILKNRVLPEGLIQSARSFTK